ncbi:hypothetical protein [Haloferax volcanii]|uniref:Uncharacterized protein n=3 Tax=Haloferax volcanii TaxID=2246 RepID=D4GZS8_HALVD|nr:hypothetical protein [Haloferax volcanii]ADE03468.1 uncharacterized protein HVO_0299 [Haloferax volcanii DS2]ELY25132.1 hypothetical protein C498_17193 [Haloferax volcanii DS2]MBS8119113.1 hypothetical protein [Haloferax volcanii]MBS8124126.1 hypothetical protein [Haloferax volcanii]MBS8127995.1 hypothetical protein [Haloferax volcanii]
MAERVPEFALLIGVFLGLSATVSAAVLSGALFRPLLFGAAVCYPFAAFGVLRSEDPSEALPPRVVLGLGVAIGLLTAAAAVLERATVEPLDGVFAAVVVSLPPVAYAVRFGADVNPLSPVQSLACCAVVGTAFLALAPRLGTTSALLGFVLGLSGALYADARGFRPTHRQQRAGIAAGVFVGVAVAAAGVATGLPLGSTTATAVAAALTPSLSVALARNRRQPHRFRS